LNELTGIFDRKTEERLKKIYSLFAILGSLILLMAAAGCNSGNSSPGALLNKYFTSAVNQDYGTTYDCYYAPYKAKVNKEEYIKHRKEASVLQAYKIISLEQKNNFAHAEVLLTFAPSKKLDRQEPVSTTVKEDMVREGGDWKIKVWE
jgi:hypothetical protein